MARAARRRRAVSALLAKPQRACAATRRPAPSHTIARTVPVARPSLAGGGAALCCAIPWNA